MPTIRLFGFVFATAILSFGCSHAVRPDNRLVVTLATLDNLQAEAAKREMRLVHVDTFDDMNRELAAFEAVDVFEAYVSRQANSDPETMINRTEEAVDAAEKVCRLSQKCHELSSRFETLEKAARLNYAKYCVEQLSVFVEPGAMTRKTAVEAIATATMAVGMAKFYGADAEALQKKLASLSVQARLGYAEKAVNRLADGVEGRSGLWHDAVKDAASALAAALQAGDDISELEKRYRKLRPRACQLDELVCLW